MIETNERMKNDDILFSLFTTRMEEAELCSTRPTLKLPSRSEAYHHPLLLYSLPLPHFEIDLKLCGNRANG